MIEKKEPKGSFFYAHIAEDGRLAVILAAGDVFAPSAVKIGASLQKDVRFRNRKPRMPQKRTASAAGESASSNRV